VTTDAEWHAKEYHDLVYQVSVERPAPEYSVWSWEEMPEANRELLYEASQRFLGDGGASAEQVAIQLMAEARKFYGLGLGGVVSFPALADRLAGWASDVRRLGVELAKERGTRQLAVERMAATERRGFEAEATLREFSEEHYSGEDSKIGKIRELFMAWAMGRLSGPKVLTRLQEVLDD
jgi:hypothetical protein